MAKSLAQIIADARQIIAEPEFDNSHFTDAQLTIWANDAYRDIWRAISSGSRGGVVTKQDYTVSAQTVSLETTLMRLDSCRFKKQPQDEFSEIEILTPEEMNELYPDWENDDTGIPERAVRTGTFTLMLHPSPNAANLAQTMRTYGIYLPTALSANTDTPDLPEPCHDLIPHWIAYRCFAFLEQSERMVAELTLYRGSLRDLKGMATNFTTKAKRWRFLEQDEGDDD